MNEPIDSTLSAVDLGKTLLDYIDSIPETHRRTLGAGQVLITEGDAADTVYVLVNGVLQVSKSIAGERAIMAELDVPGTVIGEMVSMGGGHRSATVSAVSGSELIGLSSDQFQHLMSEDPVFSAALAKTAVRRAEEGELAEILVRRFGVVDQTAVATACASVGWRSLAPGEVLFSQGSPATDVYFVVRGRLKSQRIESDVDDPETLGVFAKGDVVGEFGVLSDSPRISTVAALRHTVVAAMPGDAFLGLTDARPRLLVDLALDAVSRSNRHSPPVSPATIIALAAPALERRRLIDGLVNELGTGGVVNTLSAQRVDALLETPGVSNSERGDVGDVRVSHLVHEYEIESDHLIIDMGDENCPWARRALGLADRVLVVTPARPVSEHVSRVRDLLSGSTVGVPRTLVVEHSSVGSPTETRQLLSDFSCDDAIHVSPDSERDLARAARVVAGHGTALVIGGGGARGFAHIGAYRALRELDIPIDIVGGTSIGGVLGTAIADGDTPDAILEMAERQFSGVLDYTIPVVSLIKGEKISAAASARYGDRDIEDLWKTYFSVSTDLTTSRPHLHSSGNIVTAIRATSALPGVMPPVPLGEALLVDGGVLNNLPIDIARSVAPAGTVIAFDVAPPRGPGAHGDYGLAVSGWKALRAGRGRKRSPYPRISAVLMRSMITASMRERDRQVGTGLADFYINLDMRGVSMLDFSSPSTVAERGYEAAMPALEKWIGDGAT